MTKQNVVASAAVRRAYTAAKQKEIVGYGAFVTFIAETAKAHFKAPITVAAFAAFVKDDLSVGKDVSPEDKAERNRIRARIRYGLEQAGLLEEAKRKPSAAGSKKPAKSKGQAAAEAVEAAADVAGSNPKDRFSAVCSILSAMTRAELQRVANEVATRLAAVTEESKPAKRPARKRVAKAA